MSSEAKQIRCQRNRKIYFSLLDVFRLLIFFQHDLNKSLLILQISRSHNHNDPLYCCILQTDEFDDFHFQNNLYKTIFDFLLSNQNIDKLKLIKKLHFYFCLIIFLLQCGIFVFLGGNWRKISILMHWSSSLKRWR